MATPGRLSPYLSLPRRDCVRGFVKRRSNAGRFEVGGKGFTSPLAALGYAQHKTTQDGATRYVRELGKQGSLYIVEREGRNTTTRRN